MSSTTSLLTMSQQEQEKLIDKLQIFKIQGKDKRGCTILRIIGKLFPARIVCVEAVNKYLQEKIYPSLRERQFSIVYVHTGVNRSENFPGITALRSICDEMPTNVKDHLTAVYFLHPSLQSRLFIALFGRLIFTGGVYWKLNFVTRLEFLWENVKRKAIEMPEFVYDHEEELDDYRPMMDYGMEGDHPRVYIDSTVEPAVPAYSMRFIYLEDIMRFMREDEALKTMQLFEGGTEAKGISKRALKNWVVNAFRERRALALSLNDTKTAVNKLHHMLNVLVGVIVLVVWLLILRVATTHFLVFMSSQVLLVVFMFGNTAKTTFEAIIFLFVMHPFDVGDRVEVEGTQMVVEEMNILTTVFLRYDNQKIIYPNSVLSTKPIANYYRSPDMGDAIEFCTHISTPMEKIATMKERITRYIDNKSEHWYPAPAIVMRDVEDLNRLKWSLWISHTMNHQDMGERWARRALLVEELLKIFKELDIEYRMLPFDVNVRNMPPLSSSRVPSNWSLTA